MCEEKNLRENAQDTALKIIEVSEEGQCYNVIDYFLSDTIEYKSDYYEFLRAVNSATRFDEIHIHINCYGGDLDAAIQIYHSLVRSGAHIKILVEGACMSAATIIMMCAEEIEFCPWSSIMIHAYSGGDFGKYQELQSAASFSREWFTKLIYEVYEDFLTKAEIAQGLGGKDFWMSADDASARFRKVFRKREREYSKMRKKDEQIMKKINEIYTQQETEENEEEKNTGQ